MTQPGQKARPPQYVERAQDPLMDRQAIADSIGVDSADLERWQWSVADGHYVVFVRDHEYPDQCKVYYTWPDALDATPLHPAGKITEDEKQPEKPNGSPDETPTKPTDNPGSPAVQTAPAQK